MPIDNWGFNWPTGAPYSNLAAAVNQGNLFGKQLRKHLRDSVTRQLLLHFECEQLPQSENRVMMNAQYTDLLGNLARSFNTTSQITPARRWRRRRFCRSDRPHGR